MIYEVLFTPKEECESVTVLLLKSSHESYGIFSYFQGHPNVRKPALYQWRLAGSPVRKEEKKKKKNLNKLNHLYFNIFVLLSQSLRGLDELHSFFRFFYSMIPM